MPQYAYSHQIKRAGESSMFKSFTMTATTILARSNVRNMSPERRECRLDFCTESMFLASVKLNVFFFRYFDESNLSRFPVYSYDLCQLDCKINIIVNKFGCVPFFYKKFPHEKYCNLLELLHIFRVFDGKFSAAGFISSKTISNNRLLFQSTSKQTFNLANVRLPVKM